MGAKVKDKTRAQMFSALLHEPNNFNICKITFYILFMGPIFEFVLYFLKFRIILT